MRSGPERAGPVYLRGAQVGYIAGMIGIAASTALGVAHLNLPIVAAGACSSS